MGLFNRNKNDEKYLQVLKEIRNNLKLNANDDNEIFRKIEIKFAKLNKKLIEQEEEIEVLKNSLSKLTKIVEEQNKTIYDFKETESHVNEENEDIQFTRKYSKSIIEKRPILVKLNENGHFKLKRGTESKWSINDVLQLQVLIPTRTTFHGMAKKINVSSQTASSLCYMIEKGEFDKYFKEWEQIEAKKMYGNWQPSIINNPEKRKENGYV